MNTGLASPGETQTPFVAGGKIDEARLAVQSACIHAVTDGCGEDNLACVSKQHRKMLASATDEQAPVIKMHRHTRWHSTRSQRPAISHFQGIHIKVKSFVLVFEIYVEIPFTIRDRKLRPATLPSPGFKTVILSLSPFITKMRFVKGP